ncbi:MAG: LD-carboxypeptidase [Defluviitaleaceae bacterium]|nr:LD-carboxypeptidase [Defluviitaleaceae bacterium]
MTFPPLLQPGDTVAVVALSGPCDPNRLASGVRVLESMGLRCRVTDSCRAREGFLAGPDALRLRDLHESFSSPEIRGVICARGGYGAQRLLPYIDYALIKNNPKVFAGYSDVTALHIVFNQLCKLVTFHAPMPASDFGGGDIHPETLRSFRETLFAGKTREILPTAYPYTVFVPGRAAGILTGGNLSLVASSLGTPYEIDTRRRILFLEETNEEPYKIDRMLLQLKYAGKLAAAAGIVLGDFSPQTVETLAQSVNDILLPLNVPTVVNLPCGHTSPTLTLTLGTEIVIG